MTLKIMNLLIIIVSLLVCVKADDVNVKITRHFPCATHSGPNQKNLRIKFPGYKTPGVVIHEDSSKDGNKCFRMNGGKVEIFSPGLDEKKKYYVHLETRIGVSNKPERCVKPDKNNCGGIGSCVHCDICQTLTKFKNFVQIYKGDKPANCSSKSFTPGEHNDVSLRICVPNKNQFLPLLDENNTNRAEDYWNLFFTSRGASSREIPLVIAARIFDRPINTLSIKELKDALYGSKDGMIGCHYIYATISIN